MQGLRLDHATIRTAKMEETVAFYARFLGMKPGWRPPLRSDGTWLYAEDGDYPIVHLIEAPPGQAGGMFDHFALRGSGLLDYVQKLRNASQSFEAKALPDTPFTQVHHYDPNGVKIEVIFEETAQPHMIACSIAYPPSGDGARGSGPAL